MTSPLAPNVLQSMLAEAKRAHLGGDFASARRLYEGILARNPDDPAAQVLLAELDMRDGKLMTAKKWLQRVAAAHPDSLDTRTALANVLEELGDVAATTALYRAETEREPHSHDNWVRLATSLQVAGRIEEAAAAFRHLLEQWPQTVAGYSGLASIDPKLLAPDEVDRLRAMAANERGAKDERIHAHFALGTVFEKQDDYDAAFAAFAKGNRLRRENPNLYPEPPEWMEALPAGPPVFTSVEQAQRVHDNFVRETMANFTPQYFAKFAGGGDPSRQPIFIVGMPRSGSTLLEQILSSHPAVQGLGETLALTRTFRAELAAVQRDPASAGGFYRRMGAGYLAAMKELGWDGTRRVIDKMLGNYINVGIIHLALPNAVIVHSMRDPVDTCLSCFRQLFGRRNETSFDLEAIGRHYARYREMMSHWDRVLPGRVAHVEHEKLIADADAGIRKLVASCGLAWDEACLRFNETERTVRTASVAQVRRPITTAAVERWRKYEKHLGPLFRGLGRYAPSGG